MIVSVTYVSVITCACMVLSNVHGGHETELVGVAKASPDNGPARPKHALSQSHEGNNLAASDKSPRSEPSFTQWHRFRASSTASSAASTPLSSLDAVSPLASLSLSLSSAIAYLPPLASSATLLWHTPNASPSPNFVYRRHLTDDTNSNSTTTSVLNSMPSDHLAVVRRKIDPIWLMYSTSPLQTSSSASLSLSQSNSSPPNSYSLLSDPNSVTHASNSKRQSGKLLFLHSSIEEPSPQGNLDDDLTEQMQSSAMIDESPPPQPYLDASISETSTTSSLESGNFTGDPSLSSESCSHLFLNLCNLRYSISWTIVLFIAYLIVFVIGLLGNLSVLWIVYMLKGEGKRRHSCITSAVTNYYVATGNGGGLGAGHNSQNSSYYCQHHYSTVPMITINRSNVVFYRFVCNLALADLLVVLFCLPSTFIGNIYLPWVLGRLVCKAVPYLQGVSVSASVYTLVAISIDRFYAIYYPFSKKSSTSLCWCTILLIWTWSFAISFPWLVYFEVYPVDGNDNLDQAQTFQVCRDIWPSAEMEKAHFLIVNLGLQYLIPLSVIALFYILILKKIAKRKLPKLARHMPATLKDGNRQSSLVIERSKVKVFKMLIVLVLLFALSWLPLYVIFFFIKIGPRIDDYSITSQILDTSVPVAQWLGASNSCVNPILYFFFNAKFRSYYRNSWLKTFSCLSVIRPSMSSRDDKSTVTAV